MFRIVTPQKRQENQDLLDEMYRMWCRVLVGNPGREFTGPFEDSGKDEFDSSDTVYVIVHTEYGDVAAACRLNPTTRPHMLSERFADHCDLQPFPVGSSVWECSRVVVDRSLVADPVEQFRLRCRLGLGLTVFCLANGINRVSWLTQQKFYNLAQRLWKTEPLGLPIRQGHDFAWIAAVSQIDLCALDRLMDRYRNAEEIVAQSTDPKWRTSCGTSV